MHSKKHFRCLCQLFALFYLTLTFPPFVRFFLAFFSKIVNILNSLYSKCGCYSVAKVILTDTVPLKFQGYGSSGFNSFSRGDYTAADSESKADISFSNNCDGHMKAP